MERLTKREIDNRNELGCQDCSASCRERCKKNGSMEDCRKRQIYNRLAFYENLYEDGRLITLPFSAGDPIYKLATENMRPTGEVVELEINGVALNVITEPYNAIEFHRLGKTVFLDFDEAAKAAKREH